MACFFFFNDTATTEIYTLSLHDALPIFLRHGHRRQSREKHPAVAAAEHARIADRSEEHTSELQSPCNLVCRLLLEKKKKATTSPQLTTDASTSTRPTHLTPSPYTSTRPI